jgi:hypothetical protein
MAIIISHQIRDQEFGSAIPEEAKEVLQRTARVALATPIASRGLPPGTRLLKVLSPSPALAFFRPVHRPPSTAHRSLRLPRFSGHAG